MKTIDFIYLYLNDINVILYDMIIDENYNNENFIKLNDIITKYREYNNDTLMWKTLLLNEVMRITHHSSKVNILENFGDLFSDIISIDSFLPYFDNVTKVDIDNRLSAHDEILVIKKIIDDTATCDIIRFQLVQKIQYLLITSYLYITDDEYKKIYKEVTNIKFDDSITKFYGDRFVFYFSINNEHKGNNI